MARFDHAGAAPETTLVGDITPTSTAITIAAGDGYPAGGGGKKFWLVIDPEVLGKEEKILVTSRTGTALSLASAADRGQDGTVAVSHKSGAKVRHIWSSVEADEVNAHVNDTARNDHTQYPLKSRLPFNVLDYGAVGDGVADDTAAIQAAIDAAVAVKGTVLCPAPAVTYKTTAPLIIAGPLRWLAPAGPENTSITPTSAVTTAAVDITPAASRQFIEIDGLYLNLLNAGASCVGFDLDNIQNCRFSRIKVRGGLHGFNHGFVSASHFTDIQCFNQTGSGHHFYSGTNRPISNKFVNCLNYLTSGATADMIAGFDIEAGEDFLMVNCHTLRSSNNAHNLRYGIRAVYPVANTNCYLFMVNCEFDGVSGDGTPGSNNGAAAYFKNASGVKISTSWFSAYDAGMGTVPKQPGIIIEDGRYYEISTSWISGTGVRLVGAPNQLEFEGLQFSQAGGDNAWTLAPGAAPTKLLIGQCSYTDPTKFATAADAAVIANAAVPVRRSPAWFITSDDGVGGAGRVVFENAASGKKKSIRVSSSPTGTLEWLSDAGVVIMQLTDSGALIVQNSGALILSGPGSPEGVRAAPVGSIYFRTDGGPGSTFYVKESGGSGNTGWVAK